MTYGTANNPHKFNRDVLRTWARVVAATPEVALRVHPSGVRPAAFRRNVAAAFAAEGVAADRLVWRDVRGAHLAYYNEVDITLDTFPLTGGTTTVDALMMGVPWSAWPVKASTSG